MANDTEFGAFLPTTDAYDRSLVEALDVNSPEFKDFIVRLYQTTNNIALAVNIRDAGYYTENEFINGQLWYQNKSLSSKTSQAPEYRQVYRKVVDFGALPDGTGAVTKTIAHGITVDSNTTFTRIYGAASRTATADSYIPLPYSSPTLANNILLAADATNVIVTVDATVDWSAYDVTYVVLEYIKQ